MLEIKQLHARTEEREILKGLNLEIKPGTLHAIMGPNGAGKSTLAKVLAGHPSYEVVSGEILFAGENILDKEPEERAQAGLFMSFQYPLEIGGISNEQFLFEAIKSLYKARKLPALTKEQFTEILKEHLTKMEMGDQFLVRSLNEGFSGGEKKKNEILQMALFQPRLAILDETDSGLDIDAMKVVARGINEMRSESRSFLLITHYQRLLDYVEPDFVHVLIDGRIVESGGPTLAHELEKSGYERFYQEVVS